MRSHLPLLPLELHQDGSTSHPLLHAVWGSSWHQPTGFCELRNPEVPRDMQSKGSVGHAAGWGQPLVPARVAAGAPVTAHPGTLEEEAQHGQPGGLGNIP